MYKNLKIQKDGFLMIDNNGDKQFKIDETFFDLSILNFLLVIGLYFSVFVALMIY